MSAMTSSSDGGDPSDRSFFTNAFHCPVFPGTSANAGVRAIGGSVGTMGRAAHMLPERILATVLRRIPGDDRASRYREVFHSAVHFPELQHRLEPLRDGGIGSVSAEYWRRESRRPGIETFAGPAPASAKTGRRGRGRSCRLSTSMVICSPRRGGVPSGRRRRSLPSSSVRSRIGSRSSAHQSRSSSTTRRSTAGFGGLRNRGRCAEQNGPPLLVEPRRRPQGSP